MKHILILTKKQYIREAEARQKDYQDSHHNTEIKVLRRIDDDEEIRLILENRPIGTLLIIITDDAIAGLIRKAAFKEGFSQSDVLIESINHERIRVFCSQCHEINMVNNLGDSFECKECGQLLQPSEHYSTYHRSYLGYPVL
ncbi:hypothetical protein [Bacillus sp. Marseille-Q3570]|uniref:hypothetical protein n=1 Tax=Bacillus sp. Marseille-Q3570 TaxID=2963522 RepID=UPI0021B801A4|nr:hypothetical protein [Bacillus sp. Marseille-Q3570]